MTNLDGILKSKALTLPTKVCLVKVMVFPVLMYGCESWTIKKAEHQRIDAFKLWCWRRPLRVPWTSRRSNQSILKEIGPGCSLKGLILKLKLQYFGHLMWRVNSFEKTPQRVGHDSLSCELWVERLNGTELNWCWEDWRQEKGMTEGEMVGWYHQLDGHEVEQALEIGDGQGGLACCSPWGCKESDTTEGLNDHYKEVTLGLKSKWY